MFGALRWWNGDVSVFDNLVLYVSIAVSIAGAVVNAQAARRVKPEDPGRATNFTLAAVLASFYVGIYCVSTFTDVDPLNVLSFARGLGLVAWVVVWIRPAHRASARKALTR